VGWQGDVFLLGFIPNVRKKGGESHAIITRFQLFYTVNPAGRSSPRVIAAISCPLASCTRRAFFGLHAADRLDRCQETEEIQKRAHKPRRGCLFAGALLGRKLGGWGRCKKPKCLLQQAKKPSAN
jgi:hypothetical protein